MSSTSVQREVPVVFPCEGENLVGVIHAPGVHSKIGVLAVVAGGPQYRAGVGRGLVSMARELSDAGVPMMRFDHRGLGDSAGLFAGFECLQDDLEAAIGIFEREVEGLEKIVLWGGCDAASAILINAYKYPQVVSLVVGNPWVSTSTTQQVVVRQHYKKRLLEWSFWQKLLTLEYDFLSYAREGVGSLRRRFLSSSPGKSEGQAAAEDGGESFLERMYAGVCRFEGPVLYIMSGKSLLSKEFDALVDGSPGWKKVYQRPGNERIDLPEADQAFSSVEARNTVNQSILAWLEKLS